MDYRIELKDYSKNEFMYLMRYKLKRLKMADFASTGRISTNYIKFFKLDEKYPDVIPIIEDLLKSELGRDGENHSLGISMLYGLVKRNNMEEGYKIDFTDVPYEFEAIVKHLYDYLTTYTRRQYDHSFDDSRTLTGSYIGYFRLHERFPETREYQEMILKVKTGDNDTALLGIIMLRKLIEK